MPVSGTIALNATIGGFSVPTQVSVDQELQANISQSIPAAASGSLTTRTDNDTGTITADSVSHGITTGATVDVYWTNADGSVGCQRNITVGTVSGTSIPIDSGGSVEGDNLPAADTDVTVTLQTTISGLSIEGDSLIAIVAACQGKYCMRLKESTTVHATFVGEARSPFFWWDGSPYTNPIAGDTVDNIVISQGETTAKTFNMAAALTS